MTDQHGEFIYREHIITILRYCGDENNQTDSERFSFMSWDCFMEHEQIKRETLRWATWQVKELALKTDAQVLEE